ncbi:PaaI family thioesterase [Actinocrinis puniceicyclus]|uniref:PaaI family thioesterase n=1 Tax=Actinocrinis puniceicyclus TaxID=977794 RepID=A0A8J7WQA5_9ACTN|nr:PaaI family thioesterase [Actinocrinis puniceicyclus]MBS2964835.1 PaaI family thioesterase [Actinocrinis puniceicyclus]
MGTATAPSHFEKLTRCCMACRISRFLDKTITIEKAGVARVAIPFPADLTQNSNFLHAAVLFEVGDTAGFMAANSMEETYSVLTVDYYINLMRPVQQEGISATATVVNAGKTLYVARSDIYSDSGKLVAAGQGTYMVSKIPLAELEGYEDDAGTQRADEGAADGADRDRAGADA